MNFTHNSTGAPDVIAVSFAHVRLVWCVMSLTRSMQTL